MRVRFLPQAGAELEEATEYFRVRSPSAAEGFLAAVTAAQELLLRFPHSGPPLRGNVRHILLRKYPYQLVYRVVGDDIRVYAVAHLKRKPGYWRKRIPRG
jgi:plasmid stabilization system protein ParE